ncbi:MAG: Uncharacterized protein G01um10147_857 [Microgenomates group bacterium Gr01-1014_7]|nr:MAG: Uncharacterized protein G01um10147_857 [Microgenomates group bacterium Gr01-1014_7]
MKFKPASWIIVILPAIVLSFFLVTCAGPAYAKEEGTTTRKEKVAAVKEKMATREAALKKKLDAFKDRKKATYSAKISENLNKINQKQTASMLKHLDKMTSILTKLEKIEGASTADAKTAINAAKAAVSAQAEKDYTLVVTSESKVKTDSQSLRDSLHTDLKAVRALVVDAKQSVANAIKTAKSNTKEGKGG